MSSMVPSASLCNFIAFGLVFCCSTTLVTGSDTCDSYVPSSEEHASSLMQNKRAVSKHHPDGLVQTVETKSDLVRIASRVAATGFCQSHPCSLLQEIERGLGETASMNEEGYQEVAALKSDEEMKSYILRAIEKYDLHVDNMAGCMGIVPWFSGTTAVQTYQKLEEVLLFAIFVNEQPWLHYKNSMGYTGENAALNLEGYMEIAATRNTEEMMKFARRVCENLGIKVTDESGFHAVIQYYSGSSAFQSFERLESEMQSAAAAPHTWAKFK